ncbi:MAG: hypothetical protein KatS3mg052_0098 [Candidatus Roseilinea sp.]|nr:MAG: hypothetical protein KatS3mg052_0098 [Candidatus Roseilinea sp.]
MHKKQLYTWILASGVAAVILAACGGGGSEGAGQSTPAAQPQSAAGVSRSEPTRPAATVESPRSAPATVVGETSSTPTRPAATVESPRSAPTAVADETSSIPSIETGLESLASYRVRYTFSFEGKDDEGKERKVSLEFIQEAITESKDQYVRVAGVGISNTIPNTSVLEFFNVGGVSYTYAMDDGGAKCVSFSGSDPAPDPTAILKPGDMLGGLNKARLVERGITVNGVKANHYVVDESGIGFGMFGKASGDIWVAQDGNFVVKYTGTATGKIPLFGDNSEGTATWEYQLEAINTLTAIELPQECLAQKPADDIPVPGTATDKNQFGGLITFNTADTPDQVVEFYRAELPKLGWMEGEVAELGDMRILDFTKDDRTLNITITPGKDGVSVLITEKRGE